MGSFMVLQLPGYLYIDNGYKGIPLKAKGPYKMYNNWFGWGGGKGYARWPSSSSYQQCRCKQKPISCKPSDKFVKVLSCDNTRGTVSTTCTYSQTTGTQYSDTVREQMNISDSIKAETKLQFEEVFSAGIEVRVLQYLYLTNFTKC